MKKMITTVMSLVFSLSLVSGARAEKSKRQSLDLKMVSGNYNATTTMGTFRTTERVPVTGMDLNWTFHKRFWGLSWGPVVRYRSMTASIGKSSFIGAGASIGYVSNTFEDKKKWPIGLHTHFGIGIGKLSQLSSDYKQQPFNAFANWDFGLDCKLYGQDSSEPGKLKSALVASLDLSMESGGTTLTQKNPPNLTGSSRLVGWVPKFGLSYYW